MRYFVLAFLLLSACAPPDVVQRTLSVSASGLDQVDEDAAPIYGSHADACYDSSETREAYDACIAPYDRIERALARFGRALRLAQRAKDSWRAGGEEDWPGVAACAREAALEAVRAIQAEGGTLVPPLILQALGLWDQFGGDCPTDGTEAAPPNPTEANPGLVEELD